MKYLRFLWIDKNGQEIIYRHRRVVFGVISSLFLLETSIEYHLTSTLGKCYDSITGNSRQTVERLITSFYVDNSATNLTDQESIEKIMWGERVGVHNKWGWGLQISLLRLIWNFIPDTLAIILTKKAYSLYDPENFWSNRIQCTSNFIFQVVITIARGKATLLG